MPRSAATELRALLGLRDRATTLLTLESATVDDTAEVTEARAALRRHSALIDPRLSGWAV